MKPVEDFMSNVNKNYRKKETTIRSIEKTGDRHTAHERQQLKV